MIAKTISRMTKGSFNGLAYYIAAAKDKGEKLAELWIGNCNAGSELANLDLAVTEITSTQKLNTSSKSDKTYHLLLSFQEGERPDSKKLRAITNSFLDKLGYQEHQYIAAAHSDTNHFHVHLAINKVHPDTLQSKSPWRDHYRLQECCREVEQQYGLKANPQKDKTLSPKAQDYEAHTHQKSFERYMLERKDKVMVAASTSNTWHEFHTRLAELNLGIKLRANGLDFIKISII